MPTSASMAAATPGPPAGFGNTPESSWGRCRTGLVSATMPCGPPARQRQLTFIASRPSRLNDRANAGPLCWADRADQQALCPRAPRQSGVTARSHTRLDTAKQLTTLLEDRDRTRRVPTVRPGGLSRLFAYSVPVRQDAFEGSPAVVNFQADSRVPLPDRLLAPAQRIQNRISKGAGAAVGYVRLITHRRTLE